MAICLYDGKRIIPAPFVNIQKEYNVSGDGQKLGATFFITLTGDIHAIKGSPDETGTLYQGSSYPPDAREESTYVVPNVDNDTKISYILRKQEALRALFADDGKQFEIQSFDGSSPLKCNPIIRSIEFGEGIWVDTCPYTITMTANEMTNTANTEYEDEFAVNGDDETLYIESANESWSIETQEDPVNINNPRRYLLTHTVTAKGQRVYNDVGDVINQAWDIARQFVNSKLGYDATILTGGDFADTNVTDALGHTAYNHIRSENIDELEGTCSVTEAWLLSPDSAAETFDVSTVRDASSGIVTVTINGSIQGFETRSSELALTTSKYTNASTKWATVSGQLLTRAQSYSGITLNTTVVAYTKGENPANGTINYSYEYNNKPANYITGTVAEQISVSDSWDVDVFASIPVLGRAAGPVLQPIGTKREKIRSLTIEFVMGTDLSNGTISDAYASNPFDTAPQSTDIQAIVDAIKPTVGSVFVSNQNKTWDLSSLRGSYSVEWTYGS